MRGRWQFEVPAVEAVLAAVGNDIADEPRARLAFRGHEEGPSAAVDTDDFRLGYRGDRTFLKITRRITERAGAVVPFRVSRVRHAAIITVNPVRVVAGTLRGRKLEAPAGATTRPTTDMAREAIFNALNSLDVVEGARILDCFAGTGAMGIEALSRGAAHVTFIERDRAALAALERNVTALGVKDRSTIVRGDALALASSCRDVSLVLADPPYDFAKWNELLAVLPGNLVVAESAAEVEAPDGWEMLRTRRYGRTHVTFLRRLP